MLPLNFSTTPVSTVRVMLVRNEFLTSELQTRIDELLEVITAGSLKERRERKKEIAKAKNELLPLVQEYHSYISEILPKLKDPEKKMYLKEILNKAVYEKGSKLDQLTPRQ